MKLERKELKDDWVLREIQDGEDWLQASNEGTLAVSTLPTQVHLTLLEHNVIPDPFIHSNENLEEVQRVGEQTWLYKTKFDAQRVEGKAVLVFEGLDTFCKIALNGKLIGETDNMFLPEIIDVTASLVDGSNELALLFESSFLKGRELEAAANQELPSVLADPSRVYVRKQTSQYGWDWGPALVTAGPWKPVYLETFQAKLVEPWARVELDAKLDKATITGVYLADVPQNLDASISFKVVDPLGQTRCSASAKLSDRKELACTFDIGREDLWWPVGSGGQPLFTAIWELSEGASLLDSSSQTIGLRTVELIQEPFEKEEGTSFYFKVNNVPILSLGADWINADSFVARLGPKQYQDWITLAREGNHNMIRIWGGGIMENRAFYEESDKQGLMIWHDFMWACAAYPLNEKLLASSKKEIEAQVVRLRHHPSIVLWCGNNEVEMLFNQLGWKDDGPTRQSDSLFTETMPEIVARLHPGSIYWVSSPWTAPGVPANDLKAGDVHQWSVWHMEVKPYQEYGKLAGRFMSEFGLMSSPDIRTTRSYLKGINPQDALIGSRLMEQHNKCEDQSRRLGIYLAENIPYSNTLDNYTYATQLIHSEAMTEAYRQWRRLWKSDGERYLGGIITWQLNDCWPTASWAIADYYLRPKMAYFTVKRECATYTLGIERIKGKDESAGHPRSNLTTSSLTMRIWATNSSLQPVEAKLRVKAYDTIEQKDYDISCPDQTYLVAANGSTDLTDILIGTFKKFGTQPKVVIWAELVDASSGQRLARLVDWSQPLKLNYFVNPGLSIEVKGDQVTVKATKGPAKGVWLDIDVKDLDLPKWSDNGFDLFVGESVELTAKGLNGREISARWLGDHIDDSYL